MDRIAVRVPTQEDYDELMGMYEEVDWKWAGGEDPKECNYYSKDLNSVSFRKGFDIGTKSGYERKGYKIISVNEAMGILREKYPGKFQEYAVIVGSEEEFKKLMKAYDAMGWKRSGGSEPMTVSYRPGVCIKFGDNFYQCTEEYFKGEGYGLMTTEKSLEYLKKMYPEIFGEKPKPITTKEHFEKKMKEFEEEGYKRMSGKKPTEKEFTCPLEIVTKGKVLSWKKV